MNLSTHSGPIHPQTYPPTTHSEPIHPKKDKVKNRIAVFFFFCDKSCHPQWIENLSTHNAKWTYTPTFQCTYPPTIHSEPIHTQSIVNLSTHIPQWINLSTHIPQWTYPPTVVLSTHKPIHPQTYPPTNLSTHDPEHLPYRQSLWWLMTWRSVLRVKYWQLSDTKTHN